MSRNSVISGTAKFAIGASIGAGVGAIHSMSEGRQMEDVALAFFVSVTFCTACAYIWHLLVRQ